MTKLRRKMRTAVVTAILIGLAVGMGIGAGCSNQTVRDLEGIEAQDPDSAELFVNVDGYPNVVRLCIDGVAFATTTREAQAAIMRVEEWDSECPGGAQG